MKLFRTIFASGVFLKCVLTAFTSTSLVDRSSFPACKIAFMISTENLTKRYGIRKFSRTANDISIITAAVTFNIQNVKLSNVRVAVGGVGKHVVRLAELENKLEGNKLLAPTEIEDTVKNIVAPVKDIRGGVQFKNYMAGVLISDCIYNALGP